MGLTPAAVRCRFEFSHRLDFDPVLADLAAQGPVTRIRLPYGSGDAWLVTTFDGVRQVTTDHRFSRAAVVGRDYPRMTPEPIVSPESVNVMDPPASTRLRHAATQAFTKERVALMRPAIDRVVEGLLDEMEKHGSPADLVTHLSDPLPQHIICELLAVPPTDRNELLLLTRQLLVTSPEGRTAAAEAKVRLRSYFASLIAERRRAPCDDVLTALATAPAEDGTAPLSDDELAVLAVTLILSGNDTATCQISNLTYTLLTGPAALLEAARRPADLPRVVDELLRFIPFRKGVGIPRVALEDVEIAGTLIPAGDYVHVSYLTANRDPDVFPAPDSLDADRPRHAHMTFGWGGHHCVAAPLATAQLHSAIGGLLARFPGLRPAVPADELRWDTMTIRRFPLALPLAW